MSFNAPSTARLFFVQGPSWFADGDDCSSGEVLNFTELPPLPIASSAARDGGGAAEARPLVSPMLHLGRQSPLLRSALRNDRRWSRKLIEVTTWCIHGLAAGGSLCPVDATALPFAGVRLRLCGHGGPLCVRSRGAGAMQRTVVLSEPGACAWLRHGDLLDFGGGVHVLFVAVHVRTSTARDLAEHASFVWVQPGERTVPAAPVAMWSARFGEWSAVPHFLKVKMLTEAAQLAQQSIRQDEARWRLSTSASTKAPSSVADKSGASQRGRETTRDATRPPRDPFLSPAVPSHNGEVCDDGSSGSSRSSATRPDACAEKEASDVEAATPTTSSQQHRHQPRVAHTSTTNSPQVFHDHRQTRSVPEMLGEGTEGRATTLAMQPSSQGRSPPLQRADGSGLYSRASLRASVNVHSRYSVATLSETLDDKLQEALLNLEHGGNEVGEALVMQHQQRTGLSQHAQHAAAAAAELLGAVEDDLMVSRTSSAENGASQRQPHQHDGDGGASSTVSNLRSNTRRPTKRGGRGNAASHGGRRSGSRVSADEADGENGGTLSAAKRRRRRALSTSVSLSQPQQRDSGADGVAAPPLTRADIKRQRTGHAALEDSQVVFFDH